MFWVLGVGIGSGLGVLECIVGRVRINGFGQRHSPELATPNQTHSNPKP